MLSPDEITHTTEALERLPRTLDRRPSLSERRQSILQQKQTDALPSLTTETPGAKVAWRQAALLREENRRLRFDLEEQQVELQQLATDYANLKENFDKEVEIIHNGHQQEIEHYQTHLQEMMDERNRLQSAHSALEQRYQELYHSFQDAVEEEARKVMSEATQTVILSPDKAPTVLQDVVKTLELQVRQKEDKHLVQALYLKREVQRMAEQLEQERQQIGQERQQLFAWQYRVREQAELRYKTLHDRLHSRWRTVSVLTSLGLIAFLVVLQFLCLALFRVSLLAPVSLSILTPIVVCIVLAIAFASPLTMIKHIYNSAPLRRKTR